MAAGAVPGDPSFEELFRLHAGRLTRLAHLLGADDPEDVVQEAFCRFFVVHRDGQAGNLVGYLNRMVVNEVRTRQRRTKLADRKRLHLVTAPPANEQLERNESIHELVRALHELPPRQREALVLRYWLDLPLADIAVAMQVRVGTVKSLISRGVARLGQQLEDHR
jgi:RNA polymerase sigma factor (sigma-70 family)